MIEGGVVPEIGRGAMRLRYTLASYTIWSIHGLTFLAARKIAVENEDQQPKTLY